MGSTRYRLVPSATNRESVHAQFVARYALPHAPGPALQDFAGGVADSDRHAAADGGGADQPLNARVGSPDIPHEAGLRSADGGAGDLEHLTFRHAAHGPCWP